MVPFPTPEDLMNEYYGLHVPLDEGSVVVKADHYRNSLPGLAAHLSSTAAKAFAEPPLLKALQVDPDLRIINGTPATDEVIRLTFAGKGTPDQIRATLRLAVRCGKALPTRDGAARVAANGKATGLLGLQEYCNAYIGLDCNGFVGNYMLLRGQTHFGTNRREGKKAPDWIGISELNRHTHRRKSAAEIVANDLLIWSAPLIHVAVINRVSRTDTTVEFEVVESHPYGYTPHGTTKLEGGLRLSRYRLAMTRVRGVPTAVRDGLGRFTASGGPSGQAPFHIVDVGLTWPLDKARQVMNAASRFGRKLLTHHH